MLSRLRWRSPPRSRHWRRASRPRSWSATASGWASSSTVEARWGAGAGSEIGHVKLAPNGPQCRCGQRGCIEAHLADYALYRDARTFLDLPPAVSQQPSEAQMALLRERALGGDPRLEHLFRQAGRALAEAVAATISVLRPHHVILAGPGLQAFEHDAPRL